MGGVGSGRLGGNGRDRTNDYNCLNVLHLRRAGCLADGWTGGWQWPSIDDKPNWIRLRTFGNTVFLDYRTRRQGEDWREVNQSIQMVHQKCQYGGSRPYFICQGIKSGNPCYRRVTKLYNTYPYFQCRHCANLRYPSQSEDQIDRALRRADKLRGRLGGRDFGLGAFVPRKPKGMWRRTYTRLRDEVFRLDDEVEAACAKRHLRAFGP